MAFFVIPVFLAICIGCFVRMRNLHKLRRLNTFLSDVKNTGTGPTSVLGDWMNRHKGFEKLDQYFNSENEPLDNDINADDLLSNSHEENQSNVAFQMGAIL
jgi:hypothetical protein